MNHQGVLIDIASTARVNCWQSRSRYDRGERDTNLSLKSLKNMTGSLHGWTWLVGYSYPHQTDWLQEPFMISFSAWMWMSQAMWRHVIFNSLYACYNVMSLLYQLLSVFSCNNVTLKMHWIVCVRDTLKDLEGYVCYDSYRMFSEWRGRTYYRIYCIPQYS